MKEPSPLSALVPVAGLEQRHMRRLYDRNERAHEKLRRFAPRCLAERIDRGQSIEPGEQEVSVLFADLRGFSAFAEHRPPREVFLAVSHYAQLVSGVVGDHGGLIVDFCGDGVMAVFGALEELPNKEQAALAAAREIYALVRADPPVEPEPHSAIHPVGLGVATGEAYVGEVRAGDRTFWSAVGNTTNLAARLQHLTRELGCAVAVDARTFERAGELGSGLQRLPGVPIRGRRATEDIYVLSLEQER
ncbi:MAG: adenylate/guanylate cyclase domain-containing protein [Myxococcota bacterium]|nr:adenylate/guanylate cyclase domain-containing protein [Myxococcota bacterium]